MHAKYRGLKVKHLVEKLNIYEVYSNVTICGRYLITSIMFESLGRTRHGKDNEIHFADGLLDLIK